MNGKLGIQKEDLQRTDIFCPKCEGLGTEFIGSLRIPSLCHICAGTGKLDWVERIFGKSIEPSDLTVTGIICNDKRRSHFKK